MALADAQRMVDLRPDLASLARVSYLCELHGDAGGAAEAMRQAVDAGAGAPTDLAEVRTLLGDLHLGAGRLDDAEAAYRQAVAGVPGYAAAEVGLARVTAARGRLDAAAERLDAAAERLPLPGTVALLGDVRAALGRHAEAAGQYRLVRAIEALNRVNGVTVDLELARFEADHADGAGGDPARAVAMARKARTARPTVYADDTLAWALRQAGRPRWRSPPGSVSARPRSERRGDRRRPAPDGAGRGARRRAARTAAGAGRCRRRAPGAWSRSGSRAGWCRARRRSWCCSGRSRSGTPGSGCCWWSRTGPGWRRP